MQKEYRRSTDEMCSKQVAKTESSPGLKHTKRGIQPCSDQCRVVGKGRGLSALAIG